MLPAASSEKDILIRKRTRISRGRMSKTCPFNWAVIKYMRLILWVYNIVINGEKPC